MKKYWVCIKSIVNLAICKILYGRSIIIKGIPVRIGFENISVNRGGVISVGSRINVSKGSYLICTKGGNLIIKNSVYFNRNCNIVCRGNIEIGSGCRFGPNVCIFDHDHEYGLEGVTDNYNIGNIKIGDNCWCGANVVLLKGCTIGEGSVIGAGVVFKGYLPPHSLVYNDKKNLVIKTIQ